ncbi:MarR family transcriptional regulator [Nocardia niigatensis]
MTSSAMTPPECTMLAALHKAGVACTVDVLAEQAGVPVSSALRTVKRMAAKGLIVRSERGGWKLTRRGRVLWATKGTRFAR